ncbi:MAG: NADP-dependent phosphogluconate dehydrogenase [Actinomycetaceae bacterium]|nr:NADP-dependent phosphogluconate dehydrogenase [Actinomycetaceae bacterium]
MSEPIHVVVMGVSGSGKTTVAGILQDRWGWEFAEADEFHPQANIDKMHAGIPLTDEDRAPWLKLIREWMTSQEKAGKSTIVTCSALKKGYRDVLREGGAPVVFMHLDGDHSLLASRLAARTDHFMPPSLLDSQFATLEDLTADELGAVVDIAGTPAEIASQIEVKIKELTHDSARTSAVEPAEATANVGLYGLGVMGSALARNIASRGFKTAVLNIDPQQTDRFMEAYGSQGEFVPAKSAAEFVASLERPRKILVMVTAGAPVDSVLAELSPHLESGDIVVDMGNSNFRDTRRREVAMRQRGLYFVGTGTSGGEEGALTGPALMIGGADAAYEQLRPIFEAIAARAEDGATCAVHVGPDGAGHLTKTLHNGIEYADMEVIAEIYHLLHGAFGRSNAEIADLFEAWNDTELRSYLLEISAAILRYTSDGEDFIEKVSDRAGHKGTGAWSSMIGIELGVDVGMLVNSLLARFASASKTRDAWPALEVAPYPADAFGVSDESLREALLLAKLVAYTQGLGVIRAASDSFEWGIDLAGVCRGWRAGCIIRGAMLDDFANVLDGGADPASILLSSADLVEQYLPSLRRVVAAASLAGAPSVALGSALNYLESVRADRLPTALIQAQRDYFGAHGFERVDMEGKGFHGPWHD